MHINSLAALCCLFTLPFLSSAFGVQESDTANDSTEISSTDRGDHFPRAIRNQQLISNGSSSVRYFGLTTEERKRDQEIGETAKRLRQATSEQEQAVAKKTLETLLSLDYDDRLQGYDKYLNQLEEKLGEMRTKLQKRSEAKDEMIQLRIKVLESEAEDLGWPERVSRHSNSLRTLINKSPAWRLNEPLKLDSK